jgi:hypothetical protein
MAQITSHLRLVAGYLVFLDVTRARGFAITLSRILVIGFCLSLLMQTVSCSPARLAASQPGVAREEANRLLIALPITNMDAAVASNVKVTSIKLESARLLIPTNFPLTLGNLDSKGTGLVEAAFSSSGLTANQEYLLGVRGSYVSGRKIRKFSVHRPIRLPPAAPGSAQINTAEVSPSSVSGARFPAHTSVIPADINVPGPPVPTGTVRGNFKPTSPPTRIETGNAFTPGADPPNDLVFVRNTSFGNPSALPNDPSGASGGTVFNGPETVLAAGNTYGSFSNDGGSTFKQLNPTTIFPNVDGAGKLIDGGLCCDQIIHYSFTINRFIWLMLFRAGNNGQNRMRIASASPETVVASGGTAWTFWDLTSAVFKLGSQTMDYPDLSVGDHFLYVSVDGGGGLLVARIPLTELRDGVAIHIEYTNPSDGTFAYGTHLIQNPLDEIFWAGPNTNSGMRVFSWKEGSNAYFWRDIPVNSYSKNYYGTTSPDKTDWLANFFYTGPGGTRVVSLSGTDEIWLAWTAGHGGDFPNTHIELARIRHSDFSVLDQTQIWNADVAFGFAALTTNSSNAIGISLAFGGGKYFGSPAVGVLGDGVLYTPCLSNANAGRYGDYSTVRAAFPNSSLYSAVGYCFIGKFDPHYLLFGRSADVNPEPIH